MKNEPTLDQIEDYNDNESPEKRNTVKIVVLFLIAIGVVYSLIKYNTDDNMKDYVGTPEKPGIDMRRNY